MKRRSINEDIESDRRLIKNTKFTGKYRLNDETKYNVYQLVIAYNQAFSIMFDNVEVVKAKIGVEKDHLEFWLTLVEDVGEREADNVPQDLFDRAEKIITDVFGEYFKKMRSYDPLLTWNNLNEWWYKKEESQYRFRAYSFNIYFRDKNAEDFVIIDESLKKKYDEDYQKASSEHQDESLKLDEQCFNIVASHGDAGVEVGPETEAKLKKLSELIRDYFLTAFNNNVGIEDKVDYLSDNEGGLILSYHFNPIVVRKYWKNTVDLVDSCIKKIANYVKEAFPGMEEAFPVYSGFDWKRPRWRGERWRDVYGSEYADDHIFGIAAIDRKNEDTWYDFTK